jgi:CheY-like chemotaxis protein
MTIVVPLEQAVRPAVVFLVQFDDDSREMYAEYLRGCGLTVETADTTDDGLTRGRAADVIVTEIRMPGSFDGVALVRRLREADETKRMPIIVLTTCDFEPYRRGAQAAGCDAFLGKPCCPDRLLHEIWTVLSATVSRVGLRE